MQTTFSWGTLLKRLAVLAAAALVLALTGCATQAPPPVSEQVNSYYEANKDLPNSSSSSASATSSAKPVAPLVVKRPEGQPLRVLFAGDSLTGSYFASTEDNGFRPLVVRALEKAGSVEPVGVGVPHGRLSEVEAGTDVPADANLAIIEVGTNDFGKTPVKDFRAQYDALLDTVKSKSPDAVFLCMGLWRASNEVNAGIAGKAYDSAIEASCKARHGRFVELAPVYDSFGTRGPEGVKTWIGMSDTFHPNDKGHKAISDLVLKAINIS